MHTPSQTQHAANKFIRGDLRMLGLLIIGIAVLFGIVAYFDKTSTVIDRISNWVYFATLNNS